MLDDLECQILIDYLKEANQDNWMKKFLGIVNYNKLDK